MMIPFLRPNPPSLRDLGDDLTAIERSGLFTNYGPVNTRFETELQQVFADDGACLTVCNATIGLLLAIRAVVERADTARGRPAAHGGRRYALMPSFTFAAAAMAADWAGLTPLFCDIDPDGWAASATAEETLLARYGDDIAVIVPYATFGDCIDVERYRHLSARTGIPVVIDAAASLGTLDVSGRPFAAGCPFPVVFSMHATKAFGIGEGGIVHSTDLELIHTLRTMGNFGFASPRSATMPGLNAKLSEVTALLALTRLRDFEAAARHRDALALSYRARLSHLGLQRLRAGRCASQFMPVLLPATLADRRDRIVADMAERGIGVAAYFSPHVAEQPYFVERGVSAELPVTEAISRRILSLPLWEGMDTDMVGAVCDALSAVSCLHMPVPAPRVPAGSARPTGWSAPMPVLPEPVWSGPDFGDRAADVPVLECGSLIVGGGPAGLAPLVAASRDPLLARLLQAGVIVAERGPAIGPGGIGRYLINSDSSADTFLSCVRDHADPEMAALVEHPTAQAVAPAGRDAIPLVDVASFLATLGATMTERVRRDSGRVLTGQQALWTRRRADGGWRTRLRCLSGGVETEVMSRSVLLATGGHQPEQRLHTEFVGGAPLLPDRAATLVQSDQVLTPDGLAAVVARLAGIERPRLVVLGASTSAVSCLDTLRKAFGDRLPPDGLVLMHRRLPAIFYPSVEAAREDDYAAFGPDDVCPISGFVHRFGGLRFASRRLMLDAMRIGGRLPDPRLRLHRIGDVVADRLLLDEAHLIVTAFGYRPRGLPVLDVQGRRLRLLAERPGGALVGKRCGVLDEAGRELPGLFGIGLAAGFRPGTAMGGEPSFSGQVNGLWLWQNDIGRLIAERMLRRAAPRHPPRSASVPAEADLVATALSMATMTAQRVGGSQDAQAADHTC